MRYTTTINNVKVLEWGLTLSESFVFAWLYEIPSWATNAAIDGQVWFFSSRYKACEELPTVTDRPDTMYRHYKSLEAKGLIMQKKIDGNDYILLTDKAKEWNVSGEKLGIKSERSEKNPSELGKISEHTILSYNQQQVSIKETPLEFELFRKAYPGTKLGSKTEYNNFVKKHKDHATCLNLLTPALNNQIARKQQMIAAGQFVPEWANLQTWINQRRWEQEFGQTGPQPTPSRQKLGPEHDKWY